MATEHLTKDEELTLGALVQKSLQAKELKANSKETSYELNGEELTSNQLGVIIAEGTRAADKLISSYSALVWSRARLFKSKYPSSPELEDLAQEGFIGLVRAVEKYDPSRGNKLSTVAYYWIDQAIGRSTNKTGRLIRLPENRISDFVKISRIRARYEDSDLSVDQIDEIAMEELKLSRADFINITTAASMPISLNRPVAYDGGESKELMDFIADESAAISSEEQVANDLMLEILEEKLLVLSEMERAVVASSFLLGAVTNKRKSVSEVKETFNLTPQKFKRVLNTALGKLRQELEGLDISFGDFLK